MWWPLLKQLIFYYLIFVLLIIIYYLLKTFKSYVIPKLTKVNLKKRYGSWAVVTGSTKGIGRAYANELAKQGINIFLIAIGMEDLKQASKEIMSKYGVETEILEVNFMDGAEIYKEINKKLAQKDIGILVNNVGIGMERMEPFIDATEKQNWAHIMVNIAAATFMTKMVLPQMIRKGKGAVVSLASMAGICPMPCLITYSASKSYIRFFSAGLRDELRGTGITVQTLTPFYVATDMSSRIKGMNKPSFLVPGPEDFAASAISTLGYADVTCGYPTHEIINIVSWLVPEWLAIRILGMIHQHMNSEKP